MSQLVDDFIALFDGRHDAVGTEQGGCLRVESLPNTTFEERLKWHLKLGGENAIGVYPLTHQPDGWFVHWGCVDFDEGEEASWVHARNLQKVLAKVGVCGWIERSRSKGYHVWAFARRGEWHPAGMVRRGLLVATQLAKAPTKEINPKAEGHDDPAFLGNYVRLPYPGMLDTPLGIADGARRVMVMDGGQSWNLPAFVEEAHALAGLDGLEKLAAHWKPPVRVSEIPKGEAVSEIDEDIVRRMGGLAYTIWKDGQLEGADRSGTLYKLGVKLFEDGAHTFEECIAILKDVDERLLQKYSGRADFDQRITEIMEKVWE